MAGLPNITGKYKGTFDQVSSEPGAIVTTQTTKNLNAIANGSNWGTYTIQLDASLSDQIYGNSTTVTPATCTVYFIIKF